MSEVNFQSPILEFAKLCGMTFAPVLLLFSQRPRSGDHTQEKRDVKASRFVTIAMIACLSERAEAGAAKAA